MLKPCESKAQIDGGLVKPIGVFANERLKVLPDVPTFKEKGYDVFPYGPLVQMAYLVAPAKTPEAVREKLIEDLLEGDPEPRVQGGRRAGRRASSTM